MCLHFVVGWSSFSPNVIPACTLSPSIWDRFWDLFSGSILLKLIRRRKVVPKMDNTSLNESPNFGLQSIFSQTCFRRPMCEEAPAFTQQTATYLISRIYQQSGSIHKYTQVSIVSLTQARAFGRKDSKRENQIDILMPCDSWNCKSFLIEHPCSRCCSFSSQHTEKVLRSTAFSEDSSSDFGSRILSSISIRQN